MSDDMTLEEFQEQFDMPDGFDDDLSFESTGEWDGDHDAEGYDPFEAFDGPSFEAAGLPYGAVLDTPDEWGFLKKIARGVKKVARAAAPVAKALAPLAGKAIGAAVGGPAGAMIGGQLGGLVANLEDEDGDDSADEMDADAVFVADAADEEAAHKLADASAKTRSASTAGALAAASAATLAAKAPPKVKAVMPTVASASSNVAQVMTKAKGGAVLKKALPAIQAKTVATLTAKAAKGKPVTPATAKRVMAKQTAKVLRSQGELTKAIARNEVKRRSLDKKAVMRAEGFDAY